MSYQALAALKTFECQEQVLKLSIAFTPVALKSLTQPTPVPHKVNPDLERKYSGLICGRFCIICR